jgi:hypothetical protein
MRRIPPLLESSRATYINTKHMGRYAEVGVIEIRAGLLIAGRHWDGMQKSGVIEEAAGLPISSR